MVVSGGAGNLSHTCMPPWPLWLQVVQTKAGLGAVGCSPPPSPQPQPGVLDLVQHRLSVRSRTVTDAAQLPLHLAHSAGNYEWGQVVCYLLICVLPFKCLGYPDFQVFFLQLRLSSFFCYSDLHFCCYPDFQV